MQDFGTKADNSPPPGGQLSAAEFNNLATENENAVLRSGITLSGSSATQLAESMFLHGVKSESFQDSGAANAYVATPVSGASGVLLPADYANLGGAVISFKASNANSGASTLNIGQTTGTLLGSKPIRTSADTAITANMIAAGQCITLIYNPAFNGGSGAWELISSGLISTQLITLSGTVTPTPGIRFWRVRGIGGGGGSGSTNATAAAQYAASSGGASGSFFETILTAAQVGAGVSVTIGAAGIAAAPNGNGGNGGATILGAFVTAPGGGGGLVGAPVASTASAATSGGVPGGVSTGASILNSNGVAGGFGLTLTGTTLSGTGGSTQFGSGGAPTINGIAGTGYGSGAGGVASPPSTAAKAGIAGQPGVLIIEEFA